MEHGIAHSELILDRIKTESIEKVVQSRLSQETHRTGNIKGTVPHQRTRSPLLLIKPLTRATLALRRSLKQDSTSDWHGVRLQRKLVKCVLCVTIKP